MYKEQSNSENQEFIANDAIESPKLPYMAPSVTVHGKLERLTLQGNYPTDGEEGTLG